MNEKKSVRSIFNVFLILALIFSSPSLLFQQDGEFEKEIKIIEQYFEKEIETDQIPGLSIAFYKDNFVWSKGFGYADIENSVLATPKTAFKLASVIKNMTALAIVKLASEGKISLDAEVQNYVPYYPKKNWPVTIRHLLNHTSGMGYKQMVWKPWTHKIQYDTREAIDIFKDWPLDFEPGTKMLYSSFAYNLLGAVIEEVTGMSYGQYMTENIWEPLGMYNTHLDSVEDIIPNRARGYSKTVNGIQNAGFEDSSLWFASGGCRTTVIDLINYAKGLDEGKVLSKSEQEQLYDYTVLRGGRISFYGMGWRISFKGAFWTVEHGGGSHGTRTYLLRFPYENFAVAVACNLDNIDTPHKYAYLVASLILSAYDMGAETKSPEIYATLHNIWKFGLGYFNRYKKMYTENVQDLTASFNYINNINFGSDIALKKIQDGIHPFAGSPVIKVGSYISEKLYYEYGKEKLDYCRRSGVIAFIKAYIDLYRKGNLIPEAFQLSKKIENHVLKWEKSWSKTWNEQTKIYSLFPTPLFEKAAKKISKLYRGETAYPKLIYKFINSTNYYLQTRKYDKAEELLWIGKSLYPNDGRIYDCLGRLYIEKEDFEKAHRYFKIAIEKDERYGQILELANQANLDGDKDKALAILELAVKLHPKDPVVFNEIGEYYLKEGDKDKAINFFNKCLEIDPSFTKAKDILEKLKEK